MNFKRFPFLLVALGVSIVATLKRRIWRRLTNDVGSGTQISPLFATPRDSTARVSPGALILGLS